MWSKTTSNRIDGTDFTPSRNQLVHLQHRFRGLIRPCRMSNNKHLRTGPKGNSEYCFPEISTLRVEGKQNSLFLEKPIIKCLVIPPDSKLEKKTAKT